MSRARFAEFGPYLRANGDIIVPKIYHFAPGTSTLKNAYQDRNKVTTETQPIEGDAAGIAYGFFDGLYKIQVRDENDVLLYTFDNWGESSLSTAYFDVTDPAYGAVGDDATDNEAAFERALDAAEAAGGGTLLVPPGTYRYAASPNFGRAGVSILADLKAVFHCTGGSSAFIIDGGDVGTSGFFRNRYENITVKGNASSTGGLYVRAIHHSRFVHCRVMGCATTAAAIRVEWCVANEWSTPCVSVNQGAFSSTPLIGMLLTRRGVGAEHTTTQTIINPVMEGVGGDGIKFDYTANNTIYGGTSEANDRGLYITGNAAGNEVHNLDMEDNDTEDVLCEGADNTFLGLLSTNAVRIATANGARNRFFGGRYNAITLEAAAIRNSLYGLTYSISGGALTDSATETSKHRVFNINTQTYDPDKSPGNIVATASLPAASAAMDGTVIIENVGAGDRNLIIYAGGQRFRIDGGAAV